jgi:TPR repeat protein
MDLEKLKKQAEDGSTVAQTILGMMYLHGSGTPQNFSEAMRLLSAASAAGASRATANLATMFRCGLGVNVDVTKAVGLLQTAAEAGEFTAQIDLARIYADSHGDHANGALARHWYGKALEQEARVTDCPEIEEARRYVRGSSDMPE